MKEIILEATERAKQSGKFRESNFIPGVIYGDNIDEAISVKFDALALRKIISGHGHNAKVWVKYKDSKQYGFIKEVQKHPVSGVVTHIDIQIVSIDHEIKLQIPIVYKGEEELHNRQLQMQVYKSEITVLGKMALMPDAIYVDISDKQLGDTITLDNLGLDKSLKVSEEDEVYGAIINLHIMPADDDVVEAEEETETEV